MLISLFCTGTATPKYRILIYVPSGVCFVVTHVHVCVRVHACGITEELAFIPNRPIHTIKCWTPVNSFLAFLFSSLQKYSTPFLLCNLENNGIILKIANIVQNCSHCIITGQKCKLGQICSFSSQKASKDTTRNLPPQPMPGGLTLVSDRI